MKKWLLMCVLGASFSFVQANEVNELCQSMGEFAGEVLDARKSGISRQESMSIANSALEGMSGDDRAVAKTLLNEVVQGVYSLSNADIKTANEAEARVFKREFVGAFTSTCLEEFE